MRAPRRVEDDDVVAKALGLPNGLGGDLLDWPGARMETHLLPLGERAQLLHRGRASQVQSRHKRAMAVPPGEQREFDGGGGLAGALEAGQHHDGGRTSVAKALRVATEQLDELIVDRLNHLLWSGQPVRNLGAREPFTYTLDELFDHPEVDIGLEQRQANLAKPRLHVLRAEDTAPRDLLQGRGQALA